MNTGVLTPTIRSVIISTMRSDPLTGPQLTRMEDDLAHLLPDGEQLETTLHDVGLRGRFEQPIPVPEVHLGRSLLLRHWRKFPMGGWVNWTTVAWMQREDAGQDFEVPWGRHVIAPGWGKCVAHLHDRSWEQGGFGSPYAVVYIGSGRFARRLWYIGHVNSEVVPVGATFHTGRILGRPDHSLHTGRGWVELGHAPLGYPGPFGEGARYHQLFAPVWRWSST